jgi:hypothetical protein
MWRIAVGSGRWVSGYYTAPPTCCSSTGGCGLAPTRVAELTKYPGIAASWTESTTFEPGPRQPATQVQLFEQRPVRRRRTCPPCFFVVHGRTICASHMTLMTRPEHLCGFLWNFRLAYPVSSMISLGNDQLHRAAPTAVHRIRPPEHEDRKGALDSNRYVRST